MNAVALLIENSRDKDIDKRNIEAMIRIPTRDFSEKSDNYQLHISIRFKECKHYIDCK